MKKSLVLIAILIGSVLSIQAQSCCSGSSSKEESSCCSEKKSKKNRKDRKKAKDQTSIEQVTSETFMVYGNCGMCKNTIEKAANSVEGVSSAVWDKETDMITVSFDDQITSVKEINQAIADSGYDTATHRATDSVYNKLPGCCQYERPNLKK